MKNKIRACENVGFYSENIELDENISEKEDLISILPVYLSFFVVESKFLSIIRILRLLRIFRILDLVQFTQQANQLRKALKNMVGAPKCNLLAGQSQ